MSYGSLVKLDKPHWRTITLTGSPQLKHLDSKNVAETFNVQVDYIKWIRFSLVDSPVFSRRDELPSTLNSLRQS